jgi:type IV pilus assembly protein PilC
MNPKKQTFSWQGFNAEGHTIEGSIEALNLLNAKTLLRSQGILISRISRPSFFEKTFRRLTKKEVALLLRELSTLINAGISLPQSFNILIQSTQNTVLKKVLLNLKSAIETGSSFSAALERYPHYFDPFICHLINAGEHSGTLDSMLSRIASYQEKSLRLHKKMKKAFSYPLTVLGIAAIVSSILLIKVIPGFQSLFSSAGQHLPAFTVFVLKISHGLQEYIVQILLSIATLIMTFMLTRKKNSTVRFFTDAFLLKLPLLGSFFQKIVTARFCQTFATTFAAGMPLLSALELSAKTLNNRVYEKTLQTVHQDINHGKSFYLSMLQTNRFSPLLIQMIAIGEESGKLDTMMQKTAAIYEEEIDTTLERLQHLLEPAIMTFLGIFIGGLVVAMYLPIFQLGQTLS